MTKKEKSWVLYDVGNSAFTLMIATIFPIYFNGLAASAGISEVNYLAYWGYTASIVTIIVALIGPILGSLSDYSRFKLPIFLTTVLIGVIGCLVLAVPMNWILFLVFFAIAKVGYSASLVFYDSMLIDITDETRVDKISSQGYAWGYIGSCIPFLISLIIVLFYDKLNIPMTTAMSIAIIIIAIWWFCLTIPLLKTYKQNKCIGNVKPNIKKCFSNLGNTIKDICKTPHVLLFLIAFFFYIDGVYTIIDMATAYGTALGLDTTMLLVALLVTQIVAFPFAILFGYLSKKHKVSTLLLITIVAYLGIGVFAVFLSNQIEFWILAVLVGMFQGGVQALSRSYFVKICPKEKTGSYFSIMDICGKGATILGTFLVSLFTQITNSTNGGIIVLPIMFAIGLIIFLISIKFHKKYLKKQN